jgi:tRNA (guanine37-N1)-methyltransferase
VRVDIVTLFPDMFEGFLNHGIPRIAREKKLLDVQLNDFRQYADDKRGTVDDRPYGGGAGMVLMCGPIFKAVESIESQGVEGQRPLRIMLSPQGQPLDQPLVEKLAREPWLLLLCGHYEGFDERLRTGLEPLEISLGDYVLSGGEPAAMVLVDALTRLIPGSVGDPESVADDSFSNDSRGLEYPQYTRPRVFRGMDIPEVLLSGNHARIAKWRREQGLLKTRDRRPDLLPKDDENSGETPPGLSSS